jgi:hypothetical protein
MYDHPLATYESEEDGITECNAWGYVSGLTHSYFENQDSAAGGVIKEYLSLCGAPAPYCRALIRSYKKFKNTAILREIQCLVATALEQEDEDLEDLEVGPQDPYNLQ